MKRYLSLIILVACACSAGAIDKAGLDARLRTLISKLDVLQAKPEKRIPAEQLRKAKGIILLDRTKAGFLFAYQGGGGVAMVRDTKSGKWSAPAFFKASEASLGFQIGGQQSFVAILLMSTNDAARLGESTFEFGGEASGTAGDAASKEEGTFTRDERLVQVFSDTGGLYGGVALKGGSIAPDTSANTTYYSEFLSTREILFEGKGKPTQTADTLTQKLEQYSTKK